MKYGLKCLDFTKHPYLSILWRSRVSLSNFSPKRVEINLETYLHFVQVLLKFIITFEHLIRKPIPSGTKWDVMWMQYLNSCVILNVLVPIWKVLVMKTRKAVLLFYPRTPRLPFWGIPLRILHKFHQFHLSKSGTHRTACTFRHNKKYPFHYNHHEKHNDLLIKSTVM